MLEKPLKTSSTNFTLYPLAWLAVCFALGILLETRLELAWQIYLVLV